MLSYLRKLPEETPEEGSGQHLANCKRQAEDECESNVNDNKKKKKKRKKAEYVVRDMQPPPLYSALLHFCCYFSESKVKVG